MNAIVNKWLKKNTFSHSRFRNIEKLVTLKKKRKITISLCFPTLNEEKTIGKEINVIKSILMDAHPLLDEIAVIDSGSTDNTCKVARDFGADVYIAENYLKRYGKKRVKVKTSGSQFIY